MRRVLRILVGWPSQAVLATTTAWEGHRTVHHRLTFCLVAVLFFATQLLAPSANARAAQSFAPTVQAVHPKLVKIYGAGGIEGLEAYQSGFLVSATGHVLTVWSYVLDTDYITVVLDDGRKFEAQLVGADPRIEIAVLKIEALDLPFFDLSAAVELDPGARVLAFSNVFAVASGDEPVSVLHGCVAARTPLTARRGAFATNYRGPAYILDAMTNNPGAAGGALTDRQGRLAGVLGKELRNALDNTWLNYALPIAELRSSIDAILAGNARPFSADPARPRPAEPVTLAALGVVLIPDVVAKTPPFVDHVRPGSPAAKAGLQADDLILFVNDRLVNSAKLLRDELSFVDRIDEVRLIVQRQQQLVELSLFAE